MGTDGAPVVREIFRNLTTSKGTRASQNRRELLSVFEDREAASAVLQKLIDARLLISFDSSSGAPEDSEHEVEVVHETLLSSWPRLVRWQAQDAEGAVLRDQLRQAARAWQDRGRSEDLLWTGTSYQELNLWRGRYRGGLTATEQEFADASASLSGRRRRRRRILLVSVAALAVVVAVITSSLWRQARVEARRAEASKLLALAELRLQEDPTEALALTIASLEEADTEETRVFAMKVLWEAPPAFEIAESSLDVRMPMFSPDGKWLAAAGHGENVFVWSDDGRGPLVLPGHESSPRGSNSARWASSDLLVTGPPPFVGDTVRVWSLPEGRQLRTIALGGPSYWQVGPLRLLAAALDNGSDHVASLRTWALPEGDPLLLGRIDWEQIGTGGWFDPNGRSWFYVKDRNLFGRTLPIGSEPDRLFGRFRGELLWRISSKPNTVEIADDSGETHVWSYHENGVAREKLIPKPDTASKDMLPDASGRWLAGDPQRDQQVRIWDNTGWRASRPLSLRRRASWYASQPAFHPSAQWVVASTHNYPPIDVLAPSRDLSNHRGRIHRIVSTRGFQPGRQVDRHRMGRPAAPTLAAPQEW